MWALPVFQFHLEPLLLLLEWIYSTVMQHSRRNKEMCQTLFLVLKVFRSKEGEAGWEILFDRQRTTMPLVLKDVWPVPVFKADTIQILHKDTLAWDFLFWFFAQIKHIQYKPEKEAFEYFRFYSSIYQYIQLFFTIVISWCWVSFPVNKAIASETPHQLSPGRVRLHINWVNVLWRNLCI